MNVSFEKYTEHRDKEVRELLTHTDFMEAACCASDSIIYSIFDYQRATDPDRMGRGVVMKNDKDEIVGYMGGIFQPCQYKGKNYTMYQTSSAYIDKNYRGNLSNIFRHFVDNSSTEYVLSSIGASLPSVIRSTEKVGFVQINKSRFQQQYIYPLNIKLFIEEYVSHKWMQVCAYLVRPFINLWFSKKIQTSYSVRVVNDFNQDYHLVEQAYNKRLFNKFVVQWNKELLQLKFAKRLSTDINNLRENEVIHVCVFNKNHEVIGSMVVAKVRGFNKLMVIDVQTIEQDREGVLLALFKPLLTMGYASLLIYGIEECYKKIVVKHFHLLTKQKDWRIYYMPNAEINTSDVSIVYSDDDVNY